MQSSWSPKNTDWARYFFLLQISSLLLIVGRRVRQRLWCFQISLGFCPFQCPSGFCTWATPLLSLHHVHGRYQGLARAVCGILHQFIQLYASAALVHASVTSRLDLSYISCFDCPSFIQIESSVNTGTDPVISGEHFGSRIISPWTLVGQDQFLHVILVASGCFSSGLKAFESTRQFFP